MVVVSKSVLRDFAEKYPVAANAVFKWYEVVCSADWKNFSEMKKSFNSVDAVGNDRYVFNLRGNQRTSRELSRKEGGKIFGSGSRTPIAITLLVKAND